MVLALYTFERQVIGMEKIIEHIQGLLRVTREQIGKYPVDSYWSNYYSGKETAFLQVLELLEKNKD